MLKKSKIGLHVQNMLTNLGSTKNMIGGGMFSKVVLSLFYFRDLEYLL